MINAGTLVTVAFGLVLSTQSLQSQGRPQYRGFQLGGDLPSVSALAQVATSDAKTLHQRPAAIQKLDWWPRYLVNGSTAPQSDPVHQIVFSFYDDQLSRMVVDYDRHRTAGMTEPDTIDAMSTAYGPSLKIRTVTPQIEDKDILPWGLRRAGAGVGLTVSGVDISIHRNGFKLSKSVTF